MIFRAILLVSLGVRCCVCVPAVNVSVRCGQNVSLPCHSDHINSSSGMAWYRLRSEEVTLLLSATRGKLLKNEIIVVHNEEPSRFGLEAAGQLESVRLVISAVSEADLGLYFCAAAVGVNNMRFGTAVRLTDAARRLSSHGVGCSELWVWIGVCVCVTCGFCGFLCAGVLCYRKDSSVSACVSCVKENSGVQAAPVQYSSLRFMRRSRALAPAPALVPAPAPAPAPADVTYATIAKHTR